MKCQGTISKVEINGKNYCLEGKEIKTKPFKLEGNYTIKLQSGPVFPKIGKSKKWARRRLNKNSKKLKKTSAILPIVLRQEYRHFQVMKKIKRIHPSVI